MTKPVPVAIETVWYRGRWGDSEYFYRVTWSDGTTSEEHAWKPEFNNLRKRKAPE